MAKHVINKDKSQTVLVTESDSLWTVLKGVDLTGAPAIGNAGYDDVTLSIAGKIKTTGVGITSYSTAAQAMQGLTASNVTVDVEATGKIIAGETGVSIHGNGGSVDNQGLIRGMHGRGVEFYGSDIEIVNSGRIEASVEPALYLEGGEGFNIVNSGLIGSGQVTAIWGEDLLDGTITNAKDGVIDGSVILQNTLGAVRVVNKGTIAPDLTGFAPGLALGDSNDHLINRGVIGGTINLGGGDDIADFRKDKTGPILVSGNKGDDTYIVDDTDTKIIESNFNGTDTIKTTISYALSDSATARVERLTAIGNGDINLSGNLLDNVLTGNKGDNILVGGDGNDKLTGGLGKDVLEGGVGTDDFYFFAMSGADQINDFVHGEDTIILTGIGAIGSIGDLESHLSMASNGEDTLIDLGDGNSIRLVGVKLNTLAESDFEIHM